LVFILLAFSGSFLEQIPYPVKYNYYFFIDHLFKFRYDKTAPALELFASSRHTSPTQTSSWRIISSSAKIYQLIILGSTIAVSRPVSSTPAPKGSTWFFGSAWLAIPW